MYVCEEHKYFLDRDESVIESVQEIPFVSLERERLEKYMRDQNRYWIE